LEILPRFELIGEMLSSRNDEPTEITGFMHEKYKILSSSSRSEFILQSISTVLEAICFSNHRFAVKISGHQQRWPRPFPGAILIPPALLVVTEWG
jgi:hypothetical protein